MIRQLQGPIDASAYHAQQILGVWSIDPVTIASPSSVVIDWVKVDDVQVVAWIVTAYKGQIKITERIMAIHDGDTGNDATNASYQEYAVNPLGALGVSFAVDINGAGASQLMRLVATTTETNVVVKAKRCQT